jgi:hypothetical protein
MCSDYSGNIFADAEPNLSEQVIRNDKPRFADKRNFIITDHLKEIAV